MEVTNTRVRRTMELLNIDDFHVRYVPGRKTSWKPIWAQDNIVKDLPADFSEENIRKLRWKMQE